MDVMLLTFQYRPFLLFFLFSAFVEIRCRADEDHPDEVVGLSSSLEAFFSTLKNDPSLERSITSGRYQIQGVQWIILPQTKTKIGIVLEDFETDQECGENSR